MTEELAPLLILFAALKARTAHGWTRRHQHRRGGGGDMGKGRLGEDGMGTLELVVITLGLVTVAAVLVAAITAAVTSRTSQIK